MPILAADVVVVDVATAVDHYAHDDEDLYSRLAVGRSLVSDTTHGDCDDL